MVLLEKLKRYEMTYIAVKFYAYFLMVVCAAGMIGGIYNLLKLI